MVRVAPELLEQLGEWSPPVRVRIEHTSYGYDMIAQTHVCERVVLDLEPKEG
jgi:hypothetical protein